MIGRTPLKFRPQLSLNTQGRLSDCELALLEVRVRPELNTQEDRTDSGPALLKVSRS